MASPHPDVPVGGTTGLCHCSDDTSIRAAAEWRLRDGDPTGKAIVPELKQRFGLTTIEAIEAIRRAQKMREARYAKAS